MQIVGGAFEQVLSPADHPRVNIIFPEESSALSLRQDVLTDLHLEGDDTFRQLSECSALISASQFHHMLGEE